jgi:hypothetical protein
MSIVTFTGPIKAGDVLNTTGTTAGTIKNVGFVVMAQAVPITQLATHTTALATAIVIPANSHIVNIQLLVTTAWDGAATTFSLGTSATSTELVVAGAGGTIGLSALAPGASAPRTLKWSNVGTSDVIIYVLSANTGAGVGDLIVRYMQAENA